MRIDLEHVPRVLTWLVGALLVLIIAWTLRASTAASLPVAVALVLVLAVAPVASWTSAQLPRRLHWLGNLAALLVLVLFLALFIAGLTLAAHQIIGSAGQYLPLFEKQLQQSPLSPLLQGDRQIGDMLRQLVMTAATVLGTAAHLLGTLILILFLVLLMLIEGPAWRSKLASVDRDNRKWEQALTLIGTQFRRYFLARLALGTITGLLYMAWLGLFGIDLILVWGLLALLLNFIPTVGSLVAGAFPVVFAFATRDLTTAALVAGGLLVIEQVMGNYVDPRLMGRRLTISPLVVLVSLIVWGWIWGIAGALVAVPMTVLITVTLAQLPPLRPVALFLSNDRDLQCLQEHVGPEDYKREADQGTLRD